MELEPRPERPPAAVTDADRQAAAERLVDAAGAGRLTLTEFSDRVAAVWAAGTTGQLTEATAGIELPPPSRGDQGRARPVGRGRVRAAQGLVAAAGRGARRTARRERNLIMTRRSTGCRDDGQV